MARPEFYRIRALAGTGQAGEPERAAFLLEKGPAFGAGSVAFVPSDIGRFGVGHGGEVLGIPRKIFRVSANIAEEAHAKTQRRKEGQAQWVAINHTEVFFAPWRLGVRSFSRQPSRRTHISRAMFYAK